MSKPEETNNGWFAIFLIVYWMVFFIHNNLQKVGNPWTYSDELMRDSKYEIVVMYNIYLLKFKMHNNEKY